MGTIVQYGFAIYLAFGLSLGRRLLMPLLVLMALPIVLVGPARILVGVHWSTDVLGACLLGAGALIAFLLLFEAEGTRFAGPDLLEPSVHPPTQT